MKPQLPSTPPDDALHRTQLEFSALSLTTNQQRTTIDDLPVELIIRILELGASSNNCHAWERCEVDRTFLLTNSLVSKRWSPLARALLWQHVRVERSVPLKRLLASSAFESFPTRTLWCTGDWERDDRWPPPPMPDDVKRLLKGLSGLVEVILDECFSDSCSYGDFASTNFTGLTFLGLYGVRLEDDLPQNYDLQRALPSLHTLQLSDFSSCSLKLPYTFFSCPSLANLHLSRVPLMMIKNKKRKADLTKFLTEVAAQLESFQIDIIVLRFLLPILPTFEQLENFTIYLRSPRGLEVFLLEVLSLLPLSAPFDALRFRFEWRARTDLLPKQEITAAAASAIARCSPRARPNWLVVNLRKEEELLLDPNGKLEQNLDSVGVRLHLTYT